MFLLVECDVLGASVLSPLLSPLQAGAASAHHARGLAGVTLRSYGRVGPPGDDFSRFSGPRRRGGLGWRAWGLDGSFKLV